MTAIAAPTRSLARRPALLATLAAASAALLATLVLAWLGGGADAGARTLASPSGAFELSHPAGWRAEGALLRREDGRGVVSIHEQPALDGSLAAVRRGIDRRLRRTLPGARRVAAREVALATGPGLSYTFTREREGLVHGIIVAPAGAHTLLIETAARADAPDVAREIGAMVRSLRAKGPGS